MLYSIYGLSADDVARKLDTSRKIVLRTAHDLGLPVRTGGAEAQSGPDESQLIDALYADQLVQTVLAEHEIAHEPAGGPIWQRFPEPVSLTERLVSDLYWLCGIGLIHIELVTGQPEHTVRALCGGPASPPPIPAGGHPSCADGGPDHDHTRWRCA